MYACASTKKSKKREYSASKLLLYHIFYVTLQREKVRKRVRSLKKWQKREIPVFTQS